MKSALLILFSLCFFPSAFAAGERGVTGFTGATALSMGLGEIKDEDESVPKTDMLYTEATVQLGYRFGAVAPLVQLGYRYIGQRTDPNEVNGNNVGGTGYTVGVGGDVLFSSLRFAAIYNLMGKYDLAKETSGGSKVSYDEMSGFHILLGYTWRPSWEISVSMSQNKFKRKTVGSTSTDLADNALSQTLYGVGISYLF